MSDDTNNNNARIEIESNMLVCVDKFAKTFEASARRWELVVYPSLVAFIVLAAYGFFLIYTLTSDVSRLAGSMEHVVVSMEQAVIDMNRMSNTVVSMSDNLQTIAVDASKGTESIDELVGQIDKVNQSMAVMTVPMYQMRHDMANMSHNVKNVTGPMNMVSSVFPW